MAETSIATHFKNFSDAILDTEVFRVSERDKELGRRALATLTETWADFYDVPLGMGPGAFMYFPGAFSATWKPGAAAPELRFWAMPFGKDAAVETTLTTMDAMLAKLNREFAVDLTNWNNSREIVHRLVRAQPFIFPRTFQPEIGVIIGRQELAFKMNLQIGITPMSDEFPKLAEALGVARFTEDLRVAAGHDRIWLQLDLDPPHLSNRVRFAFEHMRPTLDFVSHADPLRKFGATHGLTDPGDFRQFIGAMVPPDFRTTPPATVTTVAFRNGELFSLSYFVSRSSLVNAVGDHLSTRAIVDRLEAFGSSQDIRFTGLREMLRAAETSGCCADVDAVAYRKENGVARSSIYQYLRVPWREAYGRAFGEQGLEPKKGNP